MKMKHVLPIVLLSVMLVSGCVTQDGAAGDADAISQDMLDRCGSECATYGYQRGECVLPTEAEMPALELWECNSKLKCFCQGLGQPEQPGQPEEEFCTLQGTGYTMSLTEAMLAAEGGECLIEGSFTDVHSCNDYTGTWWIDLDIQREGCNPACVIDVQTGDSEINWRCTGLLPEQ